VSVHDCCVKESEGCIKEKEIRSFWAGAESRLTRSVEKKKGVEKERERAMSGGWPKGGDDLLGVIIHFWGEKKGGLSYLENSGDILSFQRSEAPTRAQLENRSGERIVGPGKRKKTSPGRIEVGTSCRKGFLSVKKKECEEEKRRKSSRQLVLRFKKQGRQGERSKEGKMREVTVPEYKVRIGEKRVECRRTVRN